MHLCQVNRPLRSKHREINHLQPLELPRFPVPLRAHAGAHEALVASGARHRNDREAALLGRLGLGEVARRREATAGLGEHARRGEAARIPGAGGGGRRRERRPLGEPRRRGEAERGGGVRSGGEVGVGSGGGRATRGDGSGRGCGGGSGVRVAGGVELVHRVDQLDDEGCVPVVVEAAVRPRAPPLHTRLTGAGNGGGGGSARSASGVVVGLRVG